MRDSTWSYLILLFLVESFCVLDRPFEVPLEFFSNLHMSIPYGLTRAQLDLVVILDLVCLSYTRVHSITILYSWLLCMTNSRVSNQFYFSYQSAYDIVLVPILYSASIFIIQAQAPAITFNIQACNSLFLEVKVSIWHFGSIMMVKVIFKFF